MKEKGTMRPDSKCIKCGFAYGFLYGNPRYIPPDMEDHDPYKPKPLGNLVWTCTNCGYEIITNTADVDA